MWYTIKAKVLSFFADIRLYWCGIILFGDSHYKIKGPHMREILDALEPGDVLLRKYDHYLGSRLIKGFWSHAAIYVGDNQVIHMLGEGITKEDILTFMRADHMAILRCRNKELIPISIEKAYNQFGKNILRYSTRNIKYDYDFSAEEDKFYCTEFVSFCYGHPKFENVGKFILPDDFLHSIFDKIWEC
jgi:hypothetical protein